MYHSQGLNDHFGGLACDANSLQEIKSFFQSKYGIDLSDSELLEISQSLFYLGRAISRYCQQKGVKT